jgi:hypothetical protein
MPIPTISREEVDRLATVWCKSKGVIVMLDDVSRAFAVDVANKALADFVHQAAEKVAAKKAAGQPAPPAPSKIVLTD